MIIRPYVGWSCSIALAAIALHIVHKAWNGCIVAQTFIATALTIALIVGAIWGMEI